ncbi:MAG: taurine--pyruvate aminotransferase [Clostridiaceae bacterium BRH_c20a]|nr:MAG: taurine--pyruvate aminotransferase [Clostridiaceae bacterium BRH_c20a]
MQNKTTLLSNMELIDMDKKHLWHHITNHSKFQHEDPQIIVEGKGCIIKDIHGKEYIDASSGGVWAVNVGYGRKTIADSVSEQLVKLGFFAPTVGNPASIRLAQKVISILPDFQKVFYSNTGSEANEKAFKMVRQYFRLKYKNKDKYKIVSRLRDYHGSTFAALSATGQPERKLGFEPLVPGFLEMSPCYCYRCPYNKKYPDCNIDCALELENIIKKEGEDTVGAIIVEPITSGGGILVPPKEYFKVLQEICDKYEVLMMMDEVVNGFGRTGKMFGHYHFDVKPDIVTIAKGFTSGYVPLSAFVAKQFLFDQFITDEADKMGYFRDISTFPGSAAMSAGALENINIIERENLVENSEKMGNYLLSNMKEFESFEIVGEVRGKGLLIGIEFVEDKKTKLPAKETIISEIITEINKQGVLVGKMTRSMINQNNVIFIAPPLIITKEEADKIIASIRIAIEKANTM